MDKETIKKYIQQMKEIRVLSSPRLEKQDTPETYSDRLKKNFRRIGMLAAQNRRIWDEEIKPLIEGEELLSERDVELLKEFNDSLSDSMAVENLDIAVLSILSERMLKDAEAKDDAEYIIRQLDEKIFTSNVRMYMASRIFTDEERSKKLREEGLKALDELLEYLKPERFKALPDEAKKEVLINVRYGSTMYGSVFGISDEAVDIWLQILQRAVDIYNDENYRKMFPDYDWDYFLFRTYEHYGVILDYYYKKRPAEHVSKIIASKLKQERELFRSDPEKFKEYASVEFLQINFSHAMYLSGETSVSEYRAELMELYHKRNRVEYDFDNLYVNIRSAFNYIMTMEPGELNEEDMAVLRQFYHDLCGYIFHMPNSETLEEVLEYFVPVLYYFIEVPGGITFEEMCLETMAAFHPPTYVHSLMVAQISRCLCRYLLAEKPELFVGVLGCTDKKEVGEKAYEILNFTYHAALCHDFGKLFIIDTIFIYGRKLFDPEFETIKQHPAIGAECMKKFLSTRAYADVAMGHHRWYDNTKGYPESFDTRESPERTIIDIVTCADCMDAATDTIGRSYSTGKTLEDFQKELNEGSGTRYAPYLKKLLEIPELQEDIRFLLSEGRANNYKTTYMLLRKVEESEA